MDFFDLREPVSAWSHCLGLLLSPPGILLLWRRSGGDHSKRLSLLVYGMSLAFCYTASTLYHGLRIPADRLAAFDLLDRIGIFALIAGSYTPLAWGLLRGRWRWGTLTTMLNHQKRQTLLTLFVTRRGSRLHISLGVALSHHHGR
jgi:hemolysin III